MATDPPGAAVELVALLASAGGLDALSTVLLDLPAEFPAAIVVAQHLADHGSALPTILQRDSARSVGWANDGHTVEPGKVLVGPPGRYLELTDDGRCRLRRLSGPVERRFDVLLASVASAYGRRSVAVVLSGSGSDGAAGTAAMKRAGAIVIAESPDTAQYRSMPLAAARAGADLVLPVYAIGRALNGVVAGAPLPTARCFIDARLDGHVNPPPGLTDDLAVHDAAVHDATVNATVNDAAGRGEAARLRAEELRRTRHDLEAGLGATAQTAAAARLRARESRRRAQLAHQAAAEAAARWRH